MPYLDEIKAWNIPTSHLDEVKALSQDEVKEDVEIEQSVENEIDEDEEVEMG